MAGPVNNAEKTTAEHPTPQAVISAVHRTLGFIDLDPASSAEMNRGVGAVQYFDKAADGFSQDWTQYETIYLNPPGSQTPKGEPRGRSCHEWLDKLYLATMHPKVQAAIYIGYNGPETLSRRPWILRAADALIWTSVEGTATRKEGFVPCSGRLCFQGDAPYFPSLIVYFGKTPSVFFRQFDQFGTRIEVPRYE